MELLEDGLAKLGSSFYFRIMEQVEYCCDSRQVEGFKIRRKITWQDAANKVPRLLVLHHELMADKGKYEKERGLTKFAKF